MDMVENDTAVAISSCIAIGPRAAYDIVAATYGMAIGADTVIPEGSDGHVHILGVFDGTPANLPAYKAEVDDYFTRVLSERDYDYEATCSAILALMERIASHLPADINELRIAVHTAYAAGAVRMIDAALGEGE